MPRTDTPSPTQRRVDLWPGKVWTARRRESGATTTGAAGAKSMGSGGRIPTWIRKEGEGDPGKGHGNLREKGGGVRCPRDRQNAQAQKVAIITGPLHTVFPSKRGKQRQGLWELKWGKKHATTETVRRFSSVGEQNLIFVP